MKYSALFILLFSFSFQVIATENPFDENSFEAVTKSDTDSLKSEIEILREQINIMKSENGAQASEREEADPTVIMSEPLMVINGHYFVRPVSGGLAKQVSPEQFKKILGEAY